MEKDGQFKGAITKAWKEVSSKEKRDAGCGSLGLSCTGRKNGPLLLKVGRTERSNAMGGPRPHRAKVIALLPKLKCN
jgi:hypothetical protein